METIAESERNHESITIPTLRSVTAEEGGRLPPLPLDVTLKSNFGQRPSTINDKEDESLLATMHVCSDCKESLLKSFEHCLSKGTSANLESIRLIDEEKDAIPNTEQPYFDIVHDPSKPHLVDEIRENVEKERWVMHEAKRSILQLDRATTPTKSKNLQTANFSGALYKRMLDAKDKEINKLRRKLFDAMRRTETETANVQRLRVALNRSVNYYTFAEEWQQSESMRLQRDVKYLKGEASSLMAHLINAEEQKRLLNLKIQELKESFVAKEKKLEDVMKANEELKLKLQESFKEYLWMDQNMAILRREAQKGSQAADARNVMLQKTLEKLTTDFEATTKDLSGSRARIRELEFELETLVRQFNVLGETKRAVDASYASISAQLSATDSELQALKKEHEQTLLAKSKVEADFRLAVLQHEQTLKAKEETIGTLNDQNQVLITRRNELDGIVRANKIKMDTQTANLKVIVNQKNQIQMEMQTAAVKAEKEIETRNKKIAELTESRAQDMKQMRKLQEAKEQFMFQITDLKNNLERESSTVAQLQFEINQVRRESEEKASLIEDQLDKLTAAKTNLTKDKVQLTDKLKQTRGELKAKEDKLLETEAAFEQHKQQSKQRVSTLEQNLQELQTRHNQLIDEHQTLLKEHAHLGELYKQECEKTERQQSTEEGLKHNISDLKNDLARSLSENEHLLNQLENVELENKSLKVQLEQSQTIAQNLSETLKTAIADAKTMQEGLETENGALRARLDRLTRDNDAFVQTIRELREKVKNLEIELAATQEMLAKETELRQLLENQLHENRTRYDNERRMRTEFERLSMKFKQQEMQLMMEMNAKHHLNYRKLGQVKKTMDAESQRLKDFVGMLPTQEQLGNMNEASGKEFEWLFGNDAFTTAPPERTVEKRQSRTNRTTTVDGRPRQSRGVASLVDAYKKLGNQK